MGEAFGDKLHPRRGATGSQPRSLAAQLSTQRQRRRQRRRRQGPVTLPENHFAQLSTVSPRSPLQACLNYARGPVTSPRRKSEETGLGVVFFKKNSKKQNKTKKFLEHPTQQMQFSRPLHTLTRAGRALAPSTAPSPRGARRPPQGTYLALAFECAGRRGFHLGFQISFREEGGKKKKKSNYANGLRPGEARVESDAATV